MAVVLKRRGHPLEDAARSTNTCLYVFTRMSLIDGSRSSGSSGPRPKTSSISSLKSVSRSPRLIGVPSSPSSSLTSVLISLSARARIRLGQRLEVQAVEQLLVDARLQLDVLRARHLRARAGTRSGLAER